MARITLIGVTHPYRGGLAAFNERLCQEFRKQGHEVKVVTFKMLYPSLLFPGKSQFDARQAPPFEINRGIHSLLPFNWIKQGKRIAKECPDIVIFAYWLPFLGPCFGTMARKIRKNNHTKILCLAHNIIPHEKRLGDAAMTRYFTQSMEGFLVMSASVQKDLEQFAPGKPVKQHPHPLYDHFGDRLPKAEALQKLGLDPNFQYLLFFGFIRKYKGLDWLLEAFKDERLRKLPIRLIVAGEFYTDASPYLELIDDSIKNEVKLFTRFIPEEEVRIYFSASDMVVQPYKTATQSGVTQIAYHFEKPMIVTRVGGLSEIVPHGVAGYVVETQPRAIADALVDFFTENKNEAMTRGARDQKQRFSWESMIRVCLDLADQVKK